MEVDIVWNFSLKRLNENKVVNYYQEILNEK